MPVPLPEVSPRPAHFDLAEVACMGVRRISLGGSRYRSQVERAAARVRSLLAGLP